MHISNPLGFNFGDMGGLGVGDLGTKRRGLAIFTMFKDGLKVLEAPQNIYIYTYICGNHSKPMCDASTLLLLDMLLFS